MPRCSHSELDQDQAWADGHCATCMAEARGTEALTPPQLAESLLFYRRRLKERIAITMLKRGVLSHIVKDVAENLANTLTEQLRTREHFDQED